MPQYCFLKHNRNLTFLPLDYMGFTDRFFLDVCCCDNITVSLDQSRIFIRNTKAETGQGKPGDPWIQHAMGVGCRSMIRKIQIERNSTGKKKTGMKNTTIVVFSLLCIIGMGVSGCSAPGQTISPIHTTSLSETASHGQSVTQPPSDSPRHSVAVTVQNTGKNITVTYQGGADSEKLLYSILTLNGVENIGHLENKPGSSLTTFVPINPRSQNRIIITGYFTDNTSEVLLDTML